MNASEWIPREDRPGDYERRIDATTSCAISNYEGSDDYFWQAVRGDARLHAIARGREVAMQKADEMIALPIEEFNARAVEKLVEDLREIELAIMRLAPSHEILPGYHAGYEAGVADIKRKIAAAIDMEPA